MWSDYIPAAHHRLIASALEKVESGKLNRLMIFMPPRHGKSLLCSEFFPSWYFGRNPERQIIFATYAQTLADDFGRRVRNWLRDDMYRSVFPGTLLATDSAAADKFNVGRRGAYYAAGVDGPLTGRGADCLVIDDPLKGRADADSDLVRRRLKDWYSAVAYTRLMPGGAIVIIQTRWHPDDLAGWILKEHTHEDWTVLNLAALSEDGKALWPECYPTADLERIKGALSSRDWAALYQQSPTVDGGNILKSEWWREWKRGTPACKYILQSWDTAFSDKDIKSNSYSARTTWGVFSPAEGNFGAILLNAWRGRVDYPTLKSESIRAYKADQPDAVLIEKKASGQSLIQDLRREGIPIIEYQPDRDKISRAYAVQAMLESGQIYYPQRKWADDVIRECAQFPHGESSDWTDTCTQAWLRLRNAGLLLGPDVDRSRIDDDYDDCAITRIPIKRSEYQRGIYG